MSMFKDIYHYTAIDMPSFQKGQKQIKI